MGKYHSVKYLKTLSAEEIQRYRNGLTFELEKFERRLKDEPDDEGNKQEASDLRRAIRDVDKFINTIRGGRLV